MKKLTPFFSQNPLNRLDGQRDNSDKIKEYLYSENVYFVVFNEENIYIDEPNKRYFFNKKDLEDVNFEEVSLIFLGIQNTEAYFTLSLKDFKYKKINLREFTKLEYIEESNLGIVAQGRAILSWHENHSFCAFCGGDTTIHRFGWRRDCPTCKKEHYPKVDPVVIMLTTYEDYCLLGNNIHFKNNRYSCLAGYVESAETLESAALRELYEEAGIKGKNVKYISSQPWPFPSTLMIGMHVEAISKELNIDRNEINDAKWVHKDEVKKVLNGEGNFDFTLPDNLAIARNLLEYWVSS